MHSFARRGRKRSWWRINKICRQIREKIGSSFFFIARRRTIKKVAVTKTEVGQLSFQGNERERSVLKGRMNLFQGRQSGVAKKGKQRSLNEPFSKSVSSVECDKVDFYWRNWKMRSKQARIWLMRAVYPGHFLLRGYSNRGLKVIVACIDALNMHRRITLWPS